MLRKSKFLRIAFILFGIGLVSATGTYVYVFHKPHRNIDRERPTYVLTDQELYNEFNANEEDAYLKFGNKVVQVKGTIVELNKSETNISLVLLDSFGGITCSFETQDIKKYEERFKRIQIGEEITVKGKLDGFDMIMGVVITRCVPVNI